MKTKFIPLLVIITGLLLMMYPLILFLEVKYQQELLIKDIRSTNSRLEDTSGGVDKESIVEENWDKWQATILEIPKISLEVSIVAVDDLSVFEEKANQPPGHFPGTAFPGQIGNVAIAGHRTGPAGYFRNLNKLATGEEILLHTRRKTYKYKVEKVFVTDKEHWEVIEPTDYSALTLTTCERVGLVSNAKRLIVRARLVSQL